MGKNFLLAAFTAFGVVGSIVSVPSQAEAFVYSGAKWGNQTPGTGASVTYSFMPSSLSCNAEYSGCKTINVENLLPGFQNEVRKAFAAWSAVANITFTEVADSRTAFNASGARGDIRIGAHPFDGPGGELAHAYFPQVGAPSYAGDLHFDSRDRWQIGFDGSTSTGFDIFQVATHEIGHAIGLDHSSVPNSLMNPYYTESFRGLQSDDIAGAQYIYGPRSQQQSTPISQPSSVTAPGIRSVTYRAEPPTSVPEPGTVSALFGLTLLGLGYKQRQKAKTIKGA